MIKRTVSFPYVGMSHSNYVNVSRLNSLGVFWFFCINVTVHVCVFLGQRGALLHAVS